MPHRRGEDRETTGAARSPIGYLGQSLTLFSVSPLVDIDAHRSAALMNGTRPRCCVHEVKAVELHSSVASTTDVIGNERLASSFGRPAAEVARAAELALTGFEVIRL